MPLRFVDGTKNPFLKRGGYLHRLEHFLDVRCEDPALIPDFLEVSCLAGGKNHVYRNGDVALPPGVALDEKDRPLAVVKAK